MKYFLTLITLLISTNCLGQYAIIDDHDGYVNVRSEPSSESTILSQIQANKVFVYWYSQGETEWATVQLASNPYGLGSSDFDAYSPGFVHSSRIKPIEDLAEPRDGEFSFAYELMPFDSTQRVIQRQDGIGSASIDGRWIWGTDGGLPRTEVKDVKVTIDGDSIAVNQALYRDIFECDLDVEIRVNEGYYFVYNDHSDGAGGYSLLWVFYNGDVQQRVFFVP